MLKVFFSANINTNFNIHIDNQRTTYNDKGYFSTFKVDDVEQNFKKSIKINNCTIQTILNDGVSDAFAKIAYQVTNNGDVEKTFSIATYADIQMYYNDFATITNMKDANNNDRGIQISGGGKITSLILKRLGGTDVDTYWFGHRKEMETNKFKNYETQTLKFIDSGIAFSWKDRKIRPGETLIFNIAPSPLKDPPVIKIPELEINLIDQHTYIKPGDQIKMNGHIKNLVPNKYYQCYVKSSDEIHVLKDFSINPKTEEYKIQLTEIGIQMDSYLYEGNNIISFYCADDQVQSNTVQKLVNISYKEKLTFSLDFDKDTYKQWDDIPNVNLNIRDMSGCGPLELIVKYKTSKGNDNTKSLITFFDRKIHKEKLEVEFPTDLKVGENDLEFSAVSTCSRDPNNIIKKTIKIEKSNFSFRITKAFPKITYTNELYNGIEILGEYKFALVYYYFDSDKNNVNTAWKPGDNYVFNFPKKFIGQEHSLNIYVETNGYWPIIRSITRSYNFRYAKPGADFNEISTNISNICHRSNLTTIKFNGTIDNQANKVKISCYIDEIHIKTIDIGHSFELMVNIPRSLARGYHDLQLISHYANSENSTRIYQFFYDYNETIINATTSKISPYTKFTNFNFPLNLEFITLDGSDYFNVSILLDDKEVLLEETVYDSTKEYNFPNLTNSLVNGTHKLSIHAIDSDGIKSNISIVEFEVVTPNPVLTITNNPEKQIKRLNNESLHFTAYLSQYDVLETPKLIVLLDLNENGQSEKKYLYPYTREDQYNIDIPHNLKNGTHYLMIYADVNGAVSNNFTFEFDYCYEKPELEIYYNYSRYNHSIDKNLTFKYKYSDIDSKEGGSFYYIINSIIYGPHNISIDNIIRFDIEFPPNLPEGNNTITFYAVDNDEMKSENVTISFYYQFNTPNISLNKINQSEFMMYYHPSMNISGTITDKDFDNNITIYAIIDNENNTFFVKNIEFNNDSYEFNLSFKLPDSLNEGYHNISFYAVDQYNHASDIAEQYKFRVIKYPQTLSFSHLLYLHKRITKSRK